MNARRTSFWATVICAAALTLVGCEGDDGDDGRDGAPGAAGLACWDLNENGVADLPDEDLNGDGVVDVLDCNALANPPPGGGMPIAATETCAVCHGEGSIADAAAAHALPPLATVSDVAAADDGAGNLVVSYNVQLDGESADAFTTMESNYIYTDGDTNNIVDDDALLNPVSLGNGGYNVTIPGGVALAGAASRFFLRVFDGTTRAIVLFDYPTQALPNIASDQSCQDCHSDEGVVIHPDFDYPGMVTSECTVCHKDPNWLGFVEFQDSFAGIVHGIHNSHNFPEGFYAYGEDEFDITYTTYMTNCSVCHRADELIAPDAISQLEAANSMPVNDEACFSCHGSTETMFAPDDPLYTGLHQGLDSGCETCHVAGGVAGTVVDVTDSHNGATTERGGIIWDGIDTSVTEGAKIVWEITGVADDGTNLSITWQASYDGASVDPCNATAGPGAPVFFGDGGGNLSILRNYAQGEDYILGTREDRAGQPGPDVDVDDTNTSCSGNVATTVVPVEATEAMYGRVAIQGKPRVVSIDPEDEDGLMAVRAFTPTYDWVVGTGGAAPERRAVVDSSLCLNCHVGSMYQHGGNRVDNMDMCYLCHNTAANDEYVRVDTFGVDPSEAYDGRSGQNFGLREMLHAVHSAGATTAPIVIYRGRGIYGWAGDESQLSNWPGTGPQPVFGSDDGSGNPVTTNHNFDSPTYPRRLNDCAACHVEGLAIFPDPTKSMASTVEAGEAPFGDQLNDVLEGTQTSSCMTCHRSGDPAMENALKSHAYQNGWTPQAFPEGRQSIIEANQ